MISFLALTPASIWKPPGGNKLPCGGCWWRLLVNSRHLAAMRSPALSALPAFDHASCDAVASGSALLAAAEYPLERPVVRLRKVAPPSPASPIRCGKGPRHRSQGKRKFLIITQR